MTIININQAKRIADELNINYNVIPLKTFKFAMEVELEHGTRYPESNVTNDNLLMTGKIALAHFLEYPDYYERLKVMEDEAEEYWKNKNKMSPIYKKESTINIMTIILTIIIVIIMALTCWYIYKMSVVKNNTIFF